jgi:hypothetical protein
MRAMSRLFVICIGLLAAERRRGADDSASAETKERENRAHDHN